ncbi:MAG: SGNH/GDSL hydrolase family protein [Nitrospinae bacterium]|nr:SGNH/GDSL hydrolase family protein [Nitrospinota bacterium]
MDARLLNERINTDKTASLVAYFKNRKPTQFPPPAGFKTLNSNDFNIFVFGGSSVIISDGHPFPKHLQDLLNKKSENGRKVRVTNFGVLGIDSYNVTYRAWQSLTGLKVKPDLMIVYTGHNDYNNAYRNIINKDHEGLFDLFLRISYRYTGQKFTFSNQKGFSLSKSFPDMKWFSIFNRPKFVNLAQMAGVAEISTALYEQYNKEIFLHFQDNLKLLQKMCSEAKVPLLLITPVGNIHAKPFGKTDIVDKYYDQGMKETNREKAFTLLRKAQEHELFTGDMRVKKAVRDYLIGLNNHFTIFTINLESELMDRDFSYSPDEFLDYFHLTDKTHSLIAEIIVNKINTIPLLAQRN